MTVNRHVAGRGFGGFLLREELTVGCSGNLGT